MIREPLALPSGVKPDFRAKFLVIDQAFRFLALMPCRTFCRTFCFPDSSGG
jgi:hypothetical protein